MAKTLRDEGKVSFEQDRQRFSAHRDKLLLEYRECFVAVLEGKVVDSGPDFNNLARRVFKKYGCRDLLMPWVGEELGPLEIPTPWIMKS